MNNSLVRNVIIKEKLKMSGLFKSQKQVKYMRVLNETRPDVLKSKRLIKKELFLPFFSLQPLQCREWVAQSLRCPIPHSENKYV